MPSAASSASPRSTPSTRPSSTRSARARPIARRAGARSRFGGRSRACTRASPPPHAAVGPAPPYVAVDELGADLDVIHDALIGAGCARLAAGRLRLLRRAVEVFGFHLASLDIRQHSEVHARVVQEITRRATGVDV